MKNLSLLILIGIITSLYSCSNKEQIKTFKDGNWNKDSVVYFEHYAKDTNSVFLLDYIIENNNNYLNSNIYLFTSIITPNNIEIKDTVNYWISNSRGKWLGSKQSNSWKSYLRYNKLLIFKKPGKYKFYITQGMRYNILSGIEKVGILLRKVDKKDVGKE